MTLEARRHATVAAFLMRGMRAVNDPQALPYPSEHGLKFGPMAASRGELKTLTMALTAARGAKYGLVVQLGRH
ncbi:hypothetical protein [Rhodalgimonas zhirmunskyi]|uniref:Uncharacterized protein n=1 Tax=Rhodalgimonas zhirmunskyi TaxID=2964767 RepID=A0AAJ1X829_9RHOB|nr:hypothetical protein [Rhodoalgimonas zhirmunskyi]MDQ2095182.1 hypothetical protein [Rhodoalgimonas zhirmunskyi]